MYREYTVEEPAFYHYRERFPDRVIGRVKFHPHLIKELVESNQTVVLPKMLPMIVPPRPWLTCDNGGYLRHGNGKYFLRTFYNQLQKDLLKEADNKGYLRSIFHALDVLGSTKWSINKNILKVASLCWNKGGEWVSSLSLYKQ
jgi:DNA-directed RNA polymerase